MWRMKTLLIACSIFLSSISFSQSWNQITDYSGSARDDGTSFKIGDKVYCGTGRNAGFNVTSDFKAFDLTTETWASISSMPDTCKRQYSTSFTYNGKGYLFGGVNATGDYLNDLWVYSPGADLWSYVSSMPDVGRGGMSCFVIDEFVYIVGGKSSFQPVEYDCWQFDLINSVWLEKGSLPSGGMWKGVAFTYDTTAFIGLGLDVLGEENDEFYHYEPTVDQWQLVPQLVTEPRSYVSSTRIGDSIYLYGGVDTNGVYLNTLERIELPFLGISSLNEFPSDARKGNMMFASDQDVFITTGITNTARLKETWVARNVVGLSAHHSNDFSVYQNGDELISWGPYIYDEMEVCDKMGRVVLKVKKNESGGFSINGLPDGIYFYRLIGKKATGSGRFCVWKSN